MKLIRYIVNFFESGAIKFAAGSHYPVTETTQAHAAQGLATEVDVSVDVDRARKLKERADAAAERATASARQATLDLEASIEAARIAREAEDDLQASIARELDAQAAAPTEVSYPDLDAKAPAPTSAPAPAPTPAPPSGPSRADVDGALAGLPGGHTDADYVVGAMRAQFGDAFTAADEATVRSLVVAAPPAPTDAPAPSPAPTDAPAPAPTDAPAPSPAPAESTDASAAPTADAAAADAAGTASPDQAQA